MTPAAILRLPVDHQGADEAYADELHALRADLAEDYVPRHRSDVDATTPADYQPRHLAPGATPAGSSADPSAAQTLIMPPVRTEVTR